MGGSVCLSVCGSMCMRLRICACMCGRWYEPMCVYVYCLACVDDVRVTIFLLIVDVSPGPPRLVYCVLCCFSHSKSHHGLLGHPGGTTPRLLDQKEVTDLERISAGHFGDVFRAIFERFLAVIKIPRGGNFEAQREEFNMLLRITPHPHVLTLLGGIIDYERKQVWLVLAYKSGGSLADKVKRDPSWYAWWVGCSTRARATE